MKKHLLLLLVTVTAYAVEPIKSAFGFNLGDKFENEGVGGFTTVAPRVTLLGVTPVNPHPAFDRYYVVITPKTKLIYQIWADGKNPNIGENRRAQGVLIELLAKKYGPEIKTDYVATRNGVRTINQAERSVSVRISTTGINIRYTDAELEKQATREHKELEATRDKGL